MLFGQTSEYALRVIVFLAARGNQPATNSQIAEATLVPAGYLAKIVQILSRANLVKSRRGLHGGSVLNRDPHDLSLYDVIQVIDPIRRIESCPLALAWHGQDICPLHRRLDDAIAGVETALKNATVADLLDSRDNYRSALLCPPNGSHHPPARRKLSRRIQPTKRIGARRRP